MATLKARTLDSLVTFEQLYERTRQRLVTRSEPTLERPVSQLCTQRQCESATFAHWCERMRMRQRTDFVVDFRCHRKTWEWAYILQALAASGVMQPGCRGLGFGVGTEPLTAVLAQAGCEIVATDMPVADARERGWTATDAHTSMHAAELDALNVLGICARPEFTRLVSYRTMDMTHIDPDLAGFDFVWSSCALEHLGSLAAGVAFIENSLRCLKPGGFAVHTTEYNVSSNWRTLESGATVLYRRRDIRALVRQLRGAGHATVLNLTVGRGPSDRIYDIPPYYQSGRPHLALLLNQFVVTSLGLTIRKAL
jgi:2-polyprenyl-3-methyl-5-hydroxy-6-metoxy-1,4-benzoquinol methylase